MKQRNNQTGRQTFSYAFILHICGVRTRMFAPWKVGARYSVPVQLTTVKIHVRLHAWLVAPPPAIFSFAFAWTGKMNTQLYISVDSFTVLDKHSVYIACDIVIPLFRRYGSINYSCCLYQR
jgi:hypothetical protein